jgi:multiple sugar transport system ATP-binding protein
VIEQVGTPLDLYNRPANLFVAGFIGSPRMNFLMARAARRNGPSIVVQGESGLDLAVPIADGAIKPDDAVTLGIRPEHLRIADPVNAMLTGEVQIAEQLGGETYLYVSLPSGEPLVIEIQGQSPRKPGEQIGIDFDRADAHIFDAGGRAVDLPGNGG